MINERSHSKAIVVQIALMFSSINYYDRSEKYRSLIKDQFKFLQTYKFYLL